MRPLPPSAPTSNSALHNKELRHRIEAALSKIPENYRLVFSLRKINGLNTAEVAALLKISEANVKVRLNRAKAMLQAELRKQFAREELYEFNLVHYEAVVENVMKRIGEL